MKDEMFSEYYLTPAVYSGWPKKMKPLKTPHLEHKTPADVPMYPQYYEKPKKDRLCEIKRQSEKGKIMTAHLARQI